MPATYDKDRIRFVYPDNWELSEERGELGYPLTVSVARDSAFWSVVVYNELRDTDELCKQVLQAMDGEYIDFESRPVSQKLYDCEASGLEMHFYCLDFLIASRLLAFTAGGRTFLLQTQAEDRDFDELSPVFDAISTSLIQQL